MATTSKAYYVFVLLLFSTGADAIYAQDFSFGPKAGINYGFGRHSAEITSGAGTFFPQAEPGYQAGVFLQVDSGDFYLRPELFFSYNEGAFVFPEQAARYAMEKISAPILFGYRFFRHLSIFAGPVYQHFLNVQLEYLPGLVNKQRNLAGQVGVMYEKGLFQIDLRYDSTWSSRKNQNINIPGVIKNALLDDGRLNQFMLSLSIKLFDSRNSRRTAGSCYF